MSLNTAVENSGTEGRSKTKTNSATGLAAVNCESEAAQQGLASPEGPAERCGQRGAPRSTARARLSL